MLWIAVLARIYWLVGSMFGAAVGSLIPMKLEGIDFCLTALFITIVIDQWKATKQHLPALAGFGCGIAALAVLGANKFILPALLFTSAILILYAAHQKNTEVQP